MTLRIEVPEGRDPLSWVWGDAVAGISPAASAFSAAVYADATLPLREFEAARLRIAQINGCVFCLDWRTQRDGATVDDGFPDAVRAWSSSPALSERERLAAEYAERFAVDHHALDADEGFWARLRAAFSDAEVVELTLCIGSWIAFGRANHVLGLDRACALPAAASH